MRILFSMKRYHPQFIGIMRGLSKKDHDLLLVCQKTGSKDEDHSDISPQVIPYMQFLAIFRVFLPSVWFNRLMLINPFRVAMILDDFRPELIVFKKMRMPNVIFYIVARIKGYRKFLVIKNTPLDSKKKTIFGIPTIHTSAGHRFSTTNEISGKLFLPYPKDSKVSNPSRFDNIEQRKISLLNVGSYGSLRKRHLWVLKCIEDKDLATKVTLTFVGVGTVNNQNYKELVAYANRIDCLDVEFLVNVPNDQMDYIYQKSDLFVFPAEKESFGMVVVEALANGLPIICSDTCGARDAVINGENGYLFQNLSYDDFSSKMEYLVLNKSIIREYSENSINHFNNKYSIDYWLERFGVFIDSEVF